MTCRERLLSAAADLLEDAAKARRDRHPDNAAWIERRALAYGAAAGYLARPTVDPCPDEEALRELPPDTAA